MTAHNDAERHEGGCLPCQVVELKASIVELKATRDRQEAILDRAMELYEESEHKGYSSVHGNDLFRVLRGWEPIR
jgi:ribonuclease HII